MKFPVLWSGLVSWVGASHRVNLMHLSPLDRNAQEKLLWLSRLDCNNHTVWAAIFPGKMIIQVVIGISECGPWYYYRGGRFNGLSLQGSVWVFRHPGTTKSVRNNKVYVRRGSTVLQNHKSAERLEPISAYSRTSIICQVVAYGRLKTKENFKLRAL